MKKIRRGILFLVYLLFWLLCFFLMRVLFVVFNKFSGFDCSVSEFFLSFWHGLRLDLSVVSYIGVITIPFFIASAFIKNQRCFRIFLHIITALLLLAVLLISVGDAETYRSWLYRIDSSVLAYFSNPSLMVASLTTLRLIMLLLLIFVLWIGLFGLYLLFVKRLMSKLEAERCWSLLFLITAAGLVITARGGLGVVPLNVSSAFFCDNDFANHSAINVTWNFGNSLAKSEDDFSEFVFFDEEVDLPGDASANPFYGQKVLTKQPKHIIFVLLEGFTATAMCYDEPAKTVTPKLLSWRDEGILFSNFYAAGDRSVRGIASIFSGTPSFPEYSIVKKPEKSKQLPSLLQRLKANGYEDMSFYYGGDVNFANMNSYLLQSGIETIKSQNNLKLNCRLTEWGYDDECMFELFYDDLQTKTDKSVSILFTLSSHEPYDVPIAPYGNKSELALAMNSYTYTDSCLNVFLTQLKRSPIWDDALVVLVSDHGKFFRIQDWARFDKTQIVMQWLGGAVAGSFECNLAADQADIAATMLTAINLDASEFIFSENIFGPTKPTAFSVCTKGFAYIESSQRVWYYPESKQIAPAYISETFFNKGKRYCQFVAQYYSKLK